MKTRVILNFAFTCTVSILLTLPAAIAQQKKTPIGTDQQCSELLKECFDDSGIKKSNCFYTTAKHPFCDGSELGSLIYRRWTLAASTTVGDQTPPGLLGPSVYNEQCISGCDTQWLSATVGGKFGIDVRKQINSCLDSCKIKNNLEVLRP